MLAGLEAFSALGFWSRLILPDEIHRPEYFACNGCRMLDSETARQMPEHAVLGWSFYVPDLGWDSYRDGRRAGPAGVGPACGSAFGDSFTHADEVEDDEAWPYRLSQRLGCEVENFGVGGYGQDQAYLKFLKVRPTGRFVILAVNQEMMRRNVAASWRFYASLPDSLPKPMFRIDADDLVLEKAPQSLDRASIAAHHRFDRYAEPFVVGFPYFPSLLRVLYYRLSPSAYAANRIEPYGSVWANEAAVDLSFRLLQRFVRDAVRQGKKIAVMLVPTAQAAAADQRLYAGYLERVRRALPEVCLIDPLPELRAQYSASGPLNAPGQHFNAAGNDAIARAAFARIRECGF